MKCCYKITDEKDSLTGVEGVYDHEIKDRFDVENKKLYTAITFEEYVKCCEQLGFDPI